MITSILYRLYGRLIRLPGVGPRIERWARAHRAWAYRMRDFALRLDQRIGRIRHAQAHPGANNEQKFDDLSWMLQGLRESQARLLHRLDAEIASATQRLDAYQHATNLKVDAAVQALLQRLERAERQLGQATVQAQRPVAPSRVLNLAKLAEQAARPQGMWLEIGCGAHPDPDRINVDQRPLPGVDLVADAARLPLPDASVTDLRAAHLIEHFTQHQFLTVILPEWSRVLAPGGKLRLITPDLTAMLAAFQRGTLSEADLVLVLYGGQDYDGDFHYHAYSPTALQAILAAHGYRDIVLTAQGRPNGLCLEFEIHASKPAASTPTAAADPLAAPAINPAL